MSTARTAHLISCHVAGLETLPASQMDCQGGCTTSSTVARIAFAQQFNFQYYPFDTQTIELDFGILGTQFQGCTAVGEQLALDPVNELIPPTSPWRIKSIRSVVRSPSRCVAEISVSRDSTVYMIKRLVPLILVGMAALSALRLNPVVPPLLGSRCSMLIFAMVLIALQSSTDLGLGDVNYLIWVDYLKVVQFTVLLCALAETVVVHHLFRKQQAQLAHIIDGQLRTLIPFGFYPLAMVSMLLMGYTFLLAGSVVFIFGFAALVAYALHKIKLKLERTSLRKRQVIASLSTLNLHDTETHGELLHEAFDMFDLDKSGGIDLKEFKGLMRALHPKITRRQMQSTVQLMGIGERDINFDEFAEGLYLFLEAFAAEIGGAQPGAQLETGASSPALGGAIPPKARRCSLFPLQGRLPTFPRRGNALTARIPAPLKAWSAGVPSQSTLGMEGTEVGERSVIFRSENSALSTQV